MNENRGVKIFFQYALLIFGLGGFNFYWYLRRGGTGSLVMAVVCGLALAGWVVFYFAYVRKKTE